MDDISSEILYYSKIKKYIASISDCYQNENPKEEDLKRLNSELNWFTIKDEAKNFRSTDVHNIMVEIDRNFYTLCSVMEQNNSISPKKYPVLEFYGKLDYLHKQVKQNEQPN